MQGLKITIYKEHDTSDFFFLVAPQIKYHSYLSHLWSCILYPITKFKKKKPFSISFDQKQLTSSSYTRN